jgi:photosystem II PsbY protein
VILQCVYHLFVLTLRVMSVALSAALCRLGVISLLFLPALGWVAFNMAQPAFNQLNRMNEIKGEAASSGGRKKRGLAGAVGMGAALSMMAAQQADAATELSQLAASDNRCVRVLRPSFAPSR